MKKLISMLEQKRPRDFLEYAMADNLRILEELTGTGEYPSTRSLPPVIFGPRYGPFNNTIVSIYLMNGLVLISDSILASMKMVLND